MRVYGILAESGAGLHPETLKIRPLLYAGGDLESRVKSHSSQRFNLERLGPERETGHGTTG